MLYQLSYAPLVVLLVPANLPSAPNQAAEMNKSAPVRASSTTLERVVVGLTGFEPVTSRLSGGRSNQLSYRPDDPKVAQHPHAHCGHEGAVSTCLRTGMR